MGRAGEIASMGSTHHQKVQADKLRAKCDRLAVKIVSIVAGRCATSLPAYDGIEAAREIRELLIKRFS